MALLFTDGSIILLQMLLKNWNRATPGAIELELLSSALRAHLGNLISIIVAAFITHSVNFASHLQIHVGMIEIRIDSAPSNGRAGGSEERRVPG